MSRQTRSHVFSALLILIVLLSSIGNGMVSAAPSESLTPSSVFTATPTLLPPPAGTPTPSVQPGAKPQAWIDETIDLDQFPPEGALVIHFNTPMSPESSPHPILSWPTVEGVSSWDDARTALTFRPSSRLDSKKTYTFFLDPSLRSTNGDALENAPEWIVHVQSGPKILGVSPAPGSLEQRYRVIEVRFSREMKQSVSDEMLSIEPPIPFELKWKNTRILQITLGQPLQAGQRYDLTLNGGNHEHAVLAADGTYLAEAYRWFYWQKPFEAQVSVLGGNSVAVKFSYALDKEKSGIPFSIAPPLEGEWSWSSSQEIHFTTKESIPSWREYTLSLVHALVDANGSEISTTPTLTFSGLPPIRLANPNSADSENSDLAVADPDVESIQIEFGVPVDHATAEKAFTVEPKLPGKFQWQKGSSGSKEVLVYALTELLKPSTRYTVRIDPSVRDSQGNKMIARPYVRSFETDSWPYLSPSFGELGANIQVVDANGPRRVQFGGGDEQTEFAAYPFDLIDFSRLYADHYSSRRWGANVRDIPIPADLTPTAVWKNISTRQPNDGRPVEETTLPPGLPSGLYVLNLRHNGVLYDQLFLVVTRNTLVVKNDGNDLFVWLTNINGQNVPDAEIRLYSTTGEKVREGKTDENGQYRVSIPEGAEPMFISARVEEPGLSGDVTLAGFDDWYSQFPYDYGDSSDYLPAGQPYLAYIYTERPIYRPGQTVNFKVIIRKDNDVRYDVPAEGMPVKVRVLDARGNTIENMELRTNRFGSIHGTLNISEGAMLGNYQIETNVAGVIASQPFKVEDYRKPDYQIKLTSLQPEKEDKFVWGDEMKVRINAEYYFGEPLANAKLEVKFYDYWQIETRITSSLVTDEKGETTISFQAPYNPDYRNYYWDDATGPQTVRMEVTANDGSNQMVTGDYYFSVYPASEQLKLETDGYFLQPGKAFPVTATTLDLFGQPVADHKLSLTTSSWNHSTFEFDRPEQTLELQTDAQGIARQEIKLTAGYHRLALSGVDPQGHDLEVSRWVYVFDTKDDWFERSRDEVLMISAEKDSYKPYEKARFAIESTFSGPALLTFERGSVINTKMVELTAPLTIVETEIIPEYAPNVYVVVNAWQAGSQDVGRGSYWYSEATYADSYLRLAKTQIRVDATAKALDLRITTDKQTYKPGEKLNAVIQVKDDTGKPVVAEVSLAVVDEAIYALSNDLAGDIFEAFYGPRAHSVSTSDSMAPYRIIMEGGRGGGGGGYDTPPAARSEFLDTSAWLPVIETDANGRATVAIDLPDNTTSWRLSAKAITLDNQVGQTQTNIQTKKDVFVRPVLPRVLTNGDQATLTAFIHNYSAEVQTVTVNLSAPGLEIRSQNDQQITVEPGKVRSVGWQVWVQGAKPTEVTITVRSATDVLDSVVLPLPLQPAAVKDVQNQSGQFSGTLTLALPLPNVERETSEVRLTLNRSMSGTLLNGLEYLTGYPYGCVEQTMSRALPNAVVGRAATQLGVGGPEIQARLDPLIKASIQRLYGLQHSDGGWGWWTDDVSDPYQTAWVLFGLGVMDSSGYSIEPKVMDSATQWLQQNVIDNSEVDIRTRAYALYSMAQAGRGDLEATKALIATSIYELDPFSQAALALAMNRLGHKEEAQSILDILSVGALKQDSYVYWPQPSYDGEYHNKTMASSVRTTAFVLLAYAEIEPENKLVPGTVNYLADQRHGIYGWGTTNETSFTILGLTEYLIREQNKLGRTPYEVLVNGKSLGSGILEVGHSSVSLEVPLAELKDGLNTLVVATQGGNTVYFDLSTRYDLLQSDVKAAGNIQVRRRYLDPKTNAPIEQFQAGQLIKVEMQVSVPEDAFFVAVEDYLPGGFEALNERLSATNQVNTDQWGYEDYQPYFWEQYGYNYKEIRGDRVVFFITNFEKGSRTLTYYVRVITPGQFAALSAQAYAMYDPDLWGRSESTSVKISK